MSMSVKQSSVQKAFSLHPVHEKCRTSLWAVPKDTLLGCSKMSSKVGLVIWEWQLGIVGSSESVFLYKQFSISDFQQNPTSHFTDLLPTGPKPGNTYACHFTIQTGILQIIQSCPVFQHYWHTHQMKQCTWLLNSVISCFLSS